VLVAENMPAAGVDAAAPKLPKAQILVFPLRQGLMWLP